MYDFEHLPTQWTVYIACLLVFVSYGMVVYRNVSYSILKRLFTEVNVIMMIIFTMMNTASDAMRTSNHAIMGYSYFLVVLCVICLDAIKIKNRAFILTFGLAFLVLTTYFWIGHVFLWDTRDNSQILFRGLRNEPIYKSAMKRWVFSQLIIFSCKGLKTLLLDKSGQYLLFVTSNIYRDSGEYDSQVISDNLYDDNVAAGSDAPKIAHRWGTIPVGATEKTILIVFQRWVQSVNPLCCLVARN